MIKSSGLVGMSHPMKNSHRTNNDGDLFMDKMKQVGVIDNAIFSLSIGRDNYESKMTFGGYDLE